MKVADPCSIVKVQILSGSDSDETIVDSSLSGSDDDEDELHLSRLIVANSGPLSLSPAKPLINGNNVVGQMSPEIHFINRLSAEVERDSSREVGDTAQEEEPSQSLLSVWRKDSSLAELRRSSRNGYCYDTDICDNAQRLTNSPNFEVNSRQEDLQSLQVGLAAKQQSDPETASTENVNQKELQFSNLKKMSTKVKGPDIEELMTPHHKSGNLTQMAIEISNHSCSPFIEESTEGESELTLKLVDSIISMPSPEMQSQIEQLWHCIAEEPSEGEKQAAPSSMLGDDSKLIPCLPSEHEVSNHIEKKDTWEQSLHKAGEVVQQETSVTGLQEISNLESSIDASRNCDADQQFVKVSPYPNSKESRTYTMHNLNADTSSLQLNGSTYSSAKTTTKGHHSASCKPSSRRSLRIQMKRDRRTQLKRADKVLCDTESENTTDKDLEKSGSLRKKSPNLQCKVIIGNNKRKGASSSLLPKMSFTPQHHSKETKKRVLANIHKRNFVGETRLHQAARKGDLAQVTALIEGGINVNQRDNAGWTAIHEASCNGFSEIILTLLGAGADVNSKGHDDILPIHDAVFGNHFKVAELLLEFGADLYAKDKNNKNAFDKCNEKMAEFLKSHSQLMEIQKNEKIARLNTPKLNKNSTPVQDEKGDTSRGKTVAFTTSLQETEKKQNILLSTEVYSSEDAEKYIEEMQNIQDSLNYIAAQLRHNRDELAQNYWASVDSSGEGILRDKIANLAHSQKSLLQLVHNQKHMTLKIGAYQQINSSDINNRDTSPSLLHCATSPGRNPISLILSHNEGLYANHANGSTMATTMPAVCRTQASEDSQFQTAFKRHILSSEISGTKDVPKDELASKRMKEKITNLRFDEMQLRIENGLLGKDSSSSLPTADLGGFLESKPPGEKSNSIPVKGLLNVTDESSMTCNINYQADIERQQSVYTYHQHSERPSLEDPSPNTDQSVAVVQLSEVGKPQQPQTDQKDNLKGSVNSYTVQSDMRQKMYTNTEKKTRIIPLEKLIRMGKIKPGKDVLSFQLQDYSHKATLLPDGSIRDYSGAVHRNPELWLKALLGNNISVTRKYVMSKVRYCGKELSSFMTKEYFAPKESNNSVLQDQTAVLPVICSPLESVMQVKYILPCDKSDFLPSHVIDSIWEEFMKCDEVIF